MNKRVSQYLSKTTIEVSAETYFIISISDEGWQNLLENPELSPRMTAPFLIFKDKWEVTLVLDEVDYEKMRNHLSNAKVERNYRLLSFNVELPFDVVGFMATVATIFAEKDISILPYSSYSRDHVLLSQDNLAKGLKALRGHVDEIC